MSKGEYRIFDNEGYFEPINYLYTFNSDKILINKISASFSFEHYEDFINYIELHGFKKLFTNRKFLHVMLDIDGKSYDGVDEFYIEKNNNGIIQINDYVESEVRYCSVYLYYLNTLNTFSDQIYDKIVNYRTTKYEDKNIFYRIVNSYGTYQLKKFTIDPLNIKPEYYNNEIDFNELLDTINSDNSGILLFSGYSGSGKTSLIRYLNGISERKFVFLTINEVGFFSDPSATDMLSSKLKDSVIVIEDCELLIKSRKKENNHLISTLLNVGDGILGKISNIKLILTYNNSENIDSALLRKGRCVYNKFFGFVSAENATKISKDLGYNITYNKPQVLSDIFNINDNGNNNNEGKKIGF